MGSSLGFTRFAPDFTPQVIEKKSTTGFLILDRFLNELMLFDMDVSVAQQAKDLIKRDRTYVQNTIAKQKLAKLSSEDLELSIAAGRFQTQDAYVVRTFSVQTSVTSDLYKNLDTLTVTEQEVLRLLCKGLTPAEISRTRGVAISTTRTHIKTTREKLGVSRFADLIIIFHNIVVT